MNRRSPWLFVAIIALCASLYAQNLTVREIMTEPSIAGMRVENEKLSPDGSKVIFLWNTEGKMPRDLYKRRGSGKDLDPVRSAAPAKAPGSRE
jgi:hypothetical protein